MDLDIQVMATVVALVVVGCVAVVIQLAVVQQPEVVLGVQPRLHTNDLIHLVPGEACAGASVGRACVPQALSVTSRLDPRRLHHEYPSFPYN